MDQKFDIPRLIALRKLTNALSDCFAKQVSQYLVSLAPMFHPKNLLGDLIRGEKQNIKGADETFLELSKLYQSVGSASPFKTSVEVKPPLDIFFSTPTITPFEYSHTLTGSAKKITIRSPLKWVLAYRDLGPPRLRELIADHARSGGLELKSSLLHYLLMHQITSKPIGIAPIFQALRFPIVSGVIEEFGKLPLTYISSPLSTARPPDDIIFMNTEIAGTTTFEEVINLEDIAKLSDPLRSQIISIVQENCGNLLEECNPVDMEHSSAE